MTTDWLTARARVVCVDDDPNILMVLARVLGSSFDVVKANDAAAALEYVAAGPPFAAIVSDYRMPDLDGVTLIGQVRELSPDTVPILLTGVGDFEIAVDSVNRGHVFRFLSKPAAPDELRSTVTAAVNQYRLITAERELLTKTLHGSIKALIDVLALAQPDAFGRATRIRRRASELADRLQVRDRWPIEIAAMLSQVGFTALSADAVSRFCSGGSLTEDERAVVANLPATAEGLIAGIPRLEAVREVLRFQDTQYDGLSTLGVPTQPGVARDAIPIGARILKVVLDCDLLEMQGLSTTNALETLRGRTGWYDTNVLAAFREQEGTGTPTLVIRELRLSHVQAGMVFAADVRAENGILLVARGQEVHMSLLERIRHQWVGFAGKLTVPMLVPSTRLGGDTPRSLEAADRA